MYVLAYGFSTLFSKSLFNFNISEEEDKCRNGEKKYLLRETLQILLLILKIS